MGNPVGVRRFEMILADGASLCIDAEAVNNSEDGLVVPELSVHFKTRDNSVNTNLFFTMHSSHDLRRLADTFNQVARFVDQINEETEYDYDEE